MTEQYQGPERRQNKTIEQLELDIIQMFDAHEAKERQWVLEIRAEILKAFPDGNLAGHCDYHELKNRAAQAEAEFWQTAKSEALKHGISGLFAVGKWVLILAALGLAYKIGLGPTAAKLFGVT